MLDIPVDVDAIEGIGVNSLLATSGERQTLFFFRSHLREIATAPASDAEKHLQMGIYLLQGNDGTQALRIVDLHAVKASSHMAKSIIKMSDKIRIRHTVTP